MRVALWCLSGFVVTCLAFWIVTSEWFPNNPFVLTLVFLFFSVPSLGAFWMIYVAIRFESHPLGLVLLAFVPYSFLWYYFERVRVRKHMTRTYSV